jgi:hypothetical protein
MKLNYTPFSSDLGRTRTGTANLSELDVVTNYIRVTLDSQVNDLGFVPTGHRHDAVWNRFIRIRPRVYPLKSKSQMEEEWRAFLKVEKQFVQECIFAFVLEQNLVRVEHEPVFWKEGAGHEQLPKEYRVVQRFSWALFTEFVNSEYPRNVNGFVEWVELMEKDVEINAIRPAKATAPTADQLKLADYESKLKKLQEELDDANRLAAQQRAELEGLNRLAFKVVETSSSGLEPEKGRDVLIADNSGFEIVIRDASIIKSDNASLEETVLSKGAVHQDPDVWIGLHSKRNSFELFNARIVGSRTLLPAEWFGKPKGKEKHYDKVEGSETHFYSATARDENTVSKPFHFHKAYVKAPAKEDEDPPWEEAFVYKKPDRGKDLPRNGTNPSDG